MYKNGLVKRGVCCFWLQNTHGYGSSKIGNNMTIAVPLSRYS